jgi:ribosomal protein S18 acetylase RimI-like enzyme
MTQESNAKKIDYRLAVFDDETDILAVLEEVAPEIPVQLDGPERQSKIKTLIRERRQSGKSWVAVDVNRRVVGFVLARPDVHDNQAAIYMDYIGVRTDSRRRKIFSTLMEKMKANDVPLIANVLHDNHSSMVDNLKNVGFTEIGTEFDAKQTKLVWSPAGKHKTVSAATQFR